MAATLCSLFVDVASAGERVVVDLPLPTRATTTLTSPSTVDGTRVAGVRTTRSEPEQAKALQVPLQASTDAPETPAQPPSESSFEPATVQFTLGQGQSLYDQFATLGLDRRALVIMVRQDRGIKRALRRLMPGQRVQVTTRDGLVQDLLLEQRGPTDMLISRGNDDRFVMKKVADHPFEATPAAQPSSLENVLASPPAPDPVPATPRQEEEPVQAATDEVADRETDTVAAEGARETDGADPETGLKALVATDPSALRRVTVRPGDSLSRIFRRLGLPPQDLASLLAADKQARRLKRLRPGQELALGITHDKRLHSVAVDLDEERTLSARRSADGNYQVEVTHHPLERRVTTASAVIENSLFLAGQRAGLSDRVIMELTEIFGWDVDFALDVRAGDRFTVIHEEMYKDGEKVRDGPILASEFVNRGRSVRAIRFVDDTGHSAYYSPDGLSMRKAFLRTPVRFSRISSRFSNGRMHPVLNRMRAHKGVDYAAPTGTAINATGDGRIVFAGRKGGYGRTVIIQHGSTYTTLYAHMSRLHRRSRPGARVRQGDTIGYVGSSGLATGPHLHYEFRVRGQHVDPLRVKLPKALPIEARYKAAFERTSRPLVSQLDTLAKTSLASND